jgi:hypothetical protein
MIISIFRGIDIKRIKKFDVLVSLKETIEKPLESSETPCIKES